MAEQQSRPGDESSQAAEAQTNASDSVQGYEPSEWFRGLLDARLAELRDDELEAARRLGKAIVTPARLPRSNPFEDDGREDRTCDKCFRYVPEGEGLGLLHAHQPPDLWLVAMLCTVCWAREVGGVDRHLDSHDPDPAGGVR